MAIPVTSIDILGLVLQANQNLRNLQRDMRNNALSWRASAVAQSAPVQILAQYMNAAATAYQTRLGWIATAQADSTNWALVSAMWTKLGGTAADFSNKVNPLTAVANQLGPIDKSTYIAIISACDQILAAVNAPLSLWPE